MGNLISDNHDNLYSNQANNNSQNDHSAQSNYNVEKPNFAKTNSRQEFGDKNHANSSNEDSENCNQDQSNIRSKLQLEIKEFKKILKSNNTYNFFLIQLESYHKIKSENQFSILAYNSRFEKVNHPYNDLKRMNLLFITHEYQKVPKSFDVCYLADQINVYTENNFFTLAKFHGFSITDSESRFIPTVLTDRPIKGPLSSLFEHQKVNSEQKYCMICGIINAIQIIHENGFVHSNLDPSTVYIDENLHVKVCDYVFVPPFDMITKRIESNDDAENRYEFSMSKKPDPTEFYQNGLYAAPEIIKGENQSFGQMIDIYSIGLIIYFILFEKDPTFSNESIVYPPEIGRKWEDLINRCINQDASLRMNADSILSILLDHSEALEMISSITPESQTTQVSTETRLYLLNLKQNYYKIIILDDIIKENLIVDEKTKLIIKAAENGDVESLEKVGNYLLKGENSLYQNEEMAYRCFEEAGKLGSVKSMTILAQMNEKGIGVNQNFKKAHKYYKIAHKKMGETEPERSKIELKIKEIEEELSTIQIKALSDQITSENVKSVLNLKYQYEITPISLNTNEFELKFKNQTEKNSSLNIIKSKKFEILEQKRNKQAIKLEFSASLIKKINIDDYYPGENNKSYIMLGNGRFSFVYLVYDKKTQKSYAAKVYDIRNEKSVINTLKKEIKVLSNINHPSIIKYIGYSELNIAQNPNDDSSSLKPTLLMEYLPNGNLEKMINSPENKFWDSTAKLKAIIGIASGINELHSHNIIHRDLKTESILLNENYEPVICDFGFSKENSSTRMTQIVGNRIYEAPEVISEVSTCYTYEADLYSFGIILFQILTGTPMKHIYSYDSISQLVKLKLKNYIPDLPEDMHPIFNYIIKSCWNTSRDERLDAITIYNILTDAIKSGEQLFDDFDKQSVEEYIMRLNKKVSAPPKDEKHHIVVNIAKDYELNEHELQKIKSLNIKEIDLKDFKEIRQLGFGGFSKVYLIKNEKTKQKYAIKKYYQTEKNKHNFIREIELQSKAQHPLIAKIVGYSLVDLHQEPSMIIVMEYYKNSTLERILKEERHNISIDEWNETMKLMYIYGIASSISYLHKHNIIHLDIKPLNILIDDLILPRISDFSISIEIDSTTKIDFGGTVPFLAPEVANRDCCSFKSDVYSFGILLYIMKYKVIPFEKVGELDYWRMVVVEQKRPNLESKMVPKVYQNLIESCWQNDQSKRPTFEVILSELENNKEFITNGVCESLYKEFISIIKADIDIAEKKLTAKFHPKDLNSLYIAKKEEIFTETEISQTFYCYLDKSLDEDYKNIEEVTVIENDSESTISEFVNKNNKHRYTVTTSNIQFESIPEAKKEAEKLFQLKHPTIERFFGFNVNEQQNPMLFSEYYPFKSLKEIINNERKGIHDINWTNTKKLINIYGIAVGMKYLHEKGMNHPTLSPKNIHVDFNYQPKLSQIGLYTQPQNSQIFTSLTSVGINEKYFYFSPEFLRGKKNCTEKSDVFSYAVVVYEILTNENLYKQCISNENTKSVVDFMSNKEQGKYQPILSEKVPKAFQDLITRCVNKEPENRPSFDFIVEKLENDPSFIQDDVDENEFNSYKKTLQNYKDQ